MTKLAEIADRQRTNIVRDILFAALVALVLIFQLFALRGTDAMPAATTQTEAAQAEPAPIVCEAGALELSPLC